MLLLGIDIGTSSVKVSVVDSQSGRLLATASCPDTEAPILSKQPGWAEQSPENKILDGADVRICADCIKLCREVLDEEGI